jgi:steroid 5-alpha reductase family enzyme
MTELFFANLPWAALGLSLLLSLVISALGFRRVDWFISLGYGFSIAAEAILFALLYRDGLSFWLVAQLLLLFAYGVRLGSYLLTREWATSFARELEASKARSADIKGGVKLAIWISVSALYVAMASPALFSLSARAAGADLPSLPIGVVIMLAGLVLETLADWQKSRFKAKNPKTFVQQGLYAVVRCPNYFGEMLFWFGLFISGVSAYQSVGNWLIAGIGVVCIELIMLGSARRLELKQAERYGGDPAYRDYVRRVPILLPLVPLYSLKDLKIYLG